MDAPATASPNSRIRQLRLFDAENPLGARVGAALFRSLPPVPGVYFFHAADGALLYIGQSNNLRARVGSYRHVSPERHPRRTLRLVHRIARIEWRECDTHEEAKELERVLILEKRPPFNRAGTWPGYPWWLTVTADGSAVQLRLTRHPLSEPDCVGPLPAGYRHAHGSLMRCVHRWLQPGRSLSDFPIGLLDFAVPLHLHVATDDAQYLAAAIRAFARGDRCDLLADLADILQGAPPLELEYWTAELEALCNFAAKRRMLPLSALAYPTAPPLPLFPGL